MKKQNVKILAVFLSASLVLNLSFYLGWIPVSGNLATAKTAPTQQALSYSVQREASCTNTLDMAQAEEWISTVNKQGIKFNNKSIYLCKEAIVAMLEQDGATGIWVRRGMDADKVIHDIGWASFEDSTVTPNAAYLLEWRSCICKPCCGSDTSDFVAVTPPTVE